MAIRGLTNKYEEEKIECIRGDDFFLNHPMRTHRSETLAVDPWSRHAPWPGIRIYRRVQSGREFVGIVFKIVRPAELRNSGLRPFSGEHPADKADRDEICDWLAFDKNYAYSHTSQRDVVQYLLSGEQRRSHFDERRDRPRGRLAGRKPETLSAEDLEALAGLG